MSNPFLRRLLLMFVGVLLGLAAALWLLRPGTTPAPWEGSDGYFLPSPLPAPGFTLTAPDGSPVSESDFPGKILAVFFGYTFCPDVCPLTLSNLRQAFRKLEETGERIQVIFITVDPERDTPERVEEYVHRFHPSFLGLTGTEREIRHVADAFGVSFARRGEGEAYTVDHTARTFVIDRQGRMPLTFPFDATPTEMARDLGRLLEQRP